MDTKTIYIELKDEGIICWRLVKAIKLEDNKYQIINANSDPDDEFWEFNSGDIVFCDKKEFSGDKQGIVAVRKI